MGSVVISIGVDLGWAVHPVGDDTSSTRYREARDAWRRACYLFDRHEIPATWFVTGHLFLAQCDSIHVDHPLDSSWFPCKPGFDHEERAIWSAPDLVEGIRRSPVGHEIGCQPFSRVDFGTDGTSQRVAAAEVRATIDAAADLGIEPAELRSFAFPNDQIGHRDVLAAYGFECYRTPQPAWGTTGRLSTVRSLLKVFTAEIGGSTPPIVEPEADDHDLVAVAISFPLFPLGGRARAAARAGRGDPIVELAKRGIEQVSESDGVFHMSFRPSDLQSEADFERLEAVLSHLADCCQQTELAVETMGAVARRLGNHATTRPTAVR